MGIENGVTCYAKLVTSKSGWVCHACASLNKLRSVQIIQKGTVHYRLYRKSSDCPLAMKYGDGIRYHLVCKPEQIEVR